MYTCSGCNKEQKRNPRLSGIEHIHEMVYPSTGSRARPVQSIIDVNVRLCRKCAKKPTVIIRHNGNTYAVSTLQLRYRVTADSNRNNEPRYTWDRREYQRPAVYLDTAHIQWVTTTSTSTPWEGYTNWSNQWECTWEVPRYRT